MKRSFPVAGLIAGLILLCGAALVLWAGSPAAPADRHAMAAANELYQAGHYPEASQLYEALAARGTRDSRLFYNLGNAYYEQDDLARARASYESAAVLAPRDPDIRYNLALVLAQGGGAPSAAAVGPLAAVADFSRDWLSLDELAVLALGAWLLCGVLTVAYRSFPAGQRPAVLRYAAWLALVVVVLAAVPLAARL